MRLDQTLEYAVAKAQFYRGAGCDGLALSWEREVAKLSGKPFDGPPLPESPAQWAHRMAPAINAAVAQAIGELVA